MTFKWGEFEKWEYDEENKVFSFTVKCAPPSPVVTLECNDVRRMRVHLKPY